MNDLDFVPRAHDLLRVARARHDRPIDLDRHGAIGELEMLEQAPNRQPIGNAARFPVQDEIHDGHSTRPDDDGHAYEAAPLALGCKGAAKSWQGWLRRAINVARKNSLARR